MRRKGIGATVFVGIFLSVLVALVFAAQDKYALRVPDGLAFSDFRGYENWQVVAVSQTEELLKVMVANPTMIEAYRSGVPANGRPFPDGSKDRKNRVETEKEHGSPICSEDTRQLTRRFFHREKQQEVPGHEGMGIRRV